MVEQERAAQGGGSAEDPSVFPEVARQFVAVASKTAEAAQFIRAAKARLEELPASRGSRRANAHLDEALLWLHVVTSPGIIS